MAFQGEHAHISMNTFHGLGGDNPCSYESSIKKMQLNLAKCAPTVNEISLTFMESAFA